MDLHFKISKFHAFIPTIVYHNCPVCFQLFLQILSLEIGISKTKKIDLTEDEKKEVNDYVEKFLKP